jgi:hypothetical protein
MSLKELCRLSCTSCQSSFNRQALLLVSSIFKPISPDCYHLPAWIKAEVCLYFLCHLLSCLSHIFCLLPLGPVVLSSLTVLFSVCLSAFFLFCVLIQKECSSGLSWFACPFGLSFIQFLLADLFSCPPALCLQALYLPCLPSLSCLS